MEGIVKIMCPAPLGEENWAEVIERIKVIQRKGAIMDSVTVDLNGAGVPQMAEIYCYVHEADIKNFEGGLDAVLVED